MQTSFKGRIVTKQNVIDAMRDFDRHYAGTEEYTSWISSRSQKYVVRHNGLQYPPKHILSLATGISVAEFSGGEQTNRVFTNLGFEVVEITDSNSSRGMLSSLTSQITGIFAGKRSNSSRALEEPTIHGFSAHNREQGSNGISPVDWSQVPVDVLTDRLARRGGAGAQTARIIGAKRCRTVADVMEISDEQWLRCNGYSPNALTILHEELTALQTLSMPIPEHAVEGRSRQEIQHDSRGMDAGDWQGDVVLPPSAPTGVTQIDSSISHSEQSDDDGIVTDETTVLSPSSTSPEQQDITTKTIINDWSQVPVIELRRRLERRPGGRSVVIAIYETGCRTIADVMKRTDEQWLRCRNIDQNLLNMLNEELTALTSTYLRTELGRQPTSGNVPKTQVFPPADFLSTKTYDQSLQSLTLWEQIQDRLSDSGTERLQHVRFTEVAGSIQNIRVRNALLRRLPPDYSLYDLVMSTDEKLQAIPNLGTKSLNALKEELINLINNLRPTGSAVVQTELLSDFTDSKTDPKTDPKTELKLTVVPDYDWQTVCQSVARVLTARQVDILQAYHGRHQVGETLATIGARLGLTRERVRQIKSKASSKFRVRISAEVAARAFHEHALRKLAQIGVEATPAVLWTALEDPRVVAKDELWLLNWFEDIYGRDWYARWILANGSPDQNKCQAISGFAAVSAVVRFLSTCAYRPLSLEEALVIARANEPTISPYDLRLQLEDHPEVRLFTHGDLQIGHVSWRWFDPQRARDSRQVEWALRLMHAPAPAGEIARTIRAQLGVMEVSAFGVADACDRNPEIFFQQGNAYGLVIWKRASALRQPLIDLLGNGYLSLPELVNLWERRYRLSINAELIFATLHHCQDSFCCIKPLHWARKDAVSTSFDDPTAFTFESLMPTL